MTQRNQPKRASGVDVIVGLNIRLFRNAAGLSQTALAEKIGVTFQQVQKYEKGGNRVTAGRPVDIARALNVDLVDLFANVEIRFGVAEDVENIVGTPQGRRVAATRIGADADDLVT